MPQCLADLWTLIRDTAVEPGRKLAVLLQMDRILGLGLAGAQEREVSLDSETRLLVEEREQARARRDWKRADEIRDLLAARGIVLQDGTGGTKVRIAAGKRDEKAVTSDGNSC